MARTRLIGSAALLAAVVAGCWLLLTRPGAGADRLAVLTGTPAAPRDSAFAVPADAPSDAERAAAEQPTALVPAGAPAPSRAPPAVGVRLTGRVARPEGTPVGDADVSFSVSATAKPSSPAATTRTSADGAFALELAGDDASYLLNRDDWLVVRGGDTDVAVREVSQLVQGERDMGLIVLPGGAGLRGRVIAPDGTPGHDVVVSVHTLTPDGRGGKGMREDADLEGADPDVAREDRSLRSLRTGPAGQFSFAGLPGGEARLEVEPRGARMVALDGLALHIGGVLDVGDVVLDEGLILEGVILTAAGQPAAGAYIRAQRERQPAPERDGNIEHTGQNWGDQWTDESGLFRLAGLARGTFQLVAQAPGHATTVVEAQAGERDVQVRLLEAATVLLELRDARTDGPVPEATITGKTDLHLADGSTLGVGNRLEVTHGEEALLPPGTWRITGLGELPTSLLVEAPGYSATRLDVPPLAPGTSIVQSLRLERPLHVRGLVVDSAAQTIAGAVVQIAPTAGPAVGQSTKMARSDAAGAFDLDGLGRGTWNIWGYADGFVGQAGGPVEIVDQDLAGVALRLVQGATIAGTALTARGDVVPEARVAAWIVRALSPVDRPVPGATLVIEADARLQRVEARTEAEGAYRLGPMPPGEYLVAAALPPDDGLSARLRKLAEAPPTETPLPAGIMRVSVAAGEKRSLDLLLPRPARVSGFVRAGGAGVSGARVGLATGAANSWTLVRAVDADAGGGFEIDDLPPVEGVVLACAPGELLPRLQRVKLAEGANVAVELSFEGPGLAGTVVDVATHHAVSGVLVHARLAKSVDAAMDPWSVLGGALGNLMSSAGMNTATVTTDAAGRFTLSHLVAGSWEATADSNGWLSAGGVTFEVDADWTPKDIEVPVKAGAVVEGSVRWTLGGPADAEVEVGLYKPEANTVARWVFASHGTYRLDGLAPGVYELRARHMVGGGDYLHTEPVTLVEGQHVTINLVLDD